MSVWARQGTTNGFYNRDLFFEKMHDGLAYCVEAIWPKAAYPPKQHTATTNAAAAKAPTTAAAMDTSAAKSDDVAVAPPTAAAADGAAKPADAAAADGVAKAIVIEAASAGAATKGAAAAAAGTGSSIRKVTAPSDAATGPVTELFVTGGGGMNLYVVLRARSQCIAARGSISSHSRLLTSSPLPVGCAGPRRSRASVKWCTRWAVTPVR